MIVRFIFTYAILTAVLGGILFYAYKAAPETRWKAIKYLLIGSSVSGMSAIIMFFIVQLF